MDPRTLVAVIVKTAGLLLVIYAFVLFSDRVGAYLLSPEQSRYLLFGLVLFPVAVPLALGALLFALPATVAAAVAGTRSTDAAGLERLLQAVIFAGIGLYVALQSALSLAYYLALLAHTRGDYAVDAFGNPSTRASVIANVAGVLVGIVLLVGARGLAALIVKLRHGS